MKWLLRVLLLWIVVGAPLAPARASELPPSPRPTASRVMLPTPAPSITSPEGKRLRSHFRGGRLTSITGWAMMSTATVMGLAAGASSEYHFNGAWYDKAAYDRVYEARSGAATEMGIAAASLGGLGLVLGISGTMVEMEALKKVGVMRNTVGMTGFTFLLVGAAGFSISPASPFVGLVAGGTATGIGVILLFAQFGLNVRATQRKLTMDDYIDLYGRPKRPRSQATVVPNLVEGGGGLAVVGRF